MPLFYREIYVMTNKLSHILSVPIILRKTVSDQQGTFYPRWMRFHTDFYGYFRRIFIGTCLSCGCGDGTDRDHSCTADADEYHPDFSSVVYENRAGSKRITVEFALIQRLCLLMMLFVPTLMLGARISVAVIAVLYSCAHFCGAFINTGANNWLISW